jgi:acetoacetate decarboxylase
MATHRLRYVRDPNKKSGFDRSKVRSTVQSLRAIYSTEPAIARALIPKPLQSANEPHVFVQYGLTTLQREDLDDISINAVTVAVKCSYEDTEGYYVIAMPMEGEFVVITGREVFGEPKKIATSVGMTIDNDSVSAHIGRRGIDFLELGGTLGADQGPSEFTEHMFCYKALPAIDGSADFDGEVLLTRLNWERYYSSVRPVTNPSIVLRDSPFDPLADVVVKDIVKMELCEGTIKTSGQVLRSVPGEWIANHIGQRFDDGEDLGIDVELDSQAALV